jgi:transcriptional regulator with XRE-family HTH domain
MKAKRTAALKALDALVGMNPGDEGLRLAAMHIRERLALPMSAILDKVPGRFVSHKAEACGVSRQSYYAWLEGKSQPSVEQAKTIAKLTGYTVEQIRGSSRVSATRTAPLAATPRLTRGRKRNSDNLPV